MVKFIFGTNLTLESNKPDKTTKMDLQSLYSHICITLEELRTSNGVMMHLLHLLVFQEFVPSRLNFPFKCGRFQMNLQIKKLIICIW